MTKLANKLGSWQQTRNVLIETLGMNSDAQATAVFSNNTNSDFQKLQRNIDTTLEKLSEHALNGLRLVDETIATSDTLNNLKRASQAAKDEADKIKKATKSIEKLTALVNLVSSVVTGISNILITIIQGFR